MRIIQYYRGTSRCGCSCDNRAVRYDHIQPSGFCEDIDKEFWKQIGDYKAEIKRISLADFFCMVLAKRLNSILITADHHEFDTIYTTGIVSVKFIR